MGAELCNNGLDDNCNGQVDEGCPCAPGMVQQCFAGPPGRRNVGICQDGTQICIGQGMWGECQGGIVPQPDQCNGADNLCNGCSQRRDCEIQCPSGADPRVPVGRPFNNYLLRGALFYRGAARSWSWRIEGGPCDRIGVALQSFEGRSDKVAVEVDQRFEKTTWFHVDALRRLTFELSGRRRQDARARAEKMYTEIGRAHV